MGKGTNTTTTQTGPNPQAASSYYNLLNQAGQVASTPYQPYGGELVAPVNQQQYAGIGGLNAAANFATPYIQQAAGYATNAAQPISQSQIQQYENPYTQQVVNATEQQFANTNAQQQQQVLGNAAAQGALGGNRTGVAQAVLAGQQQTQEAPVIAGLESQGYTTGLQTALQEQQNEANAAYSVGNLGVAGENAALTGANAQLGAGSLEQQTQQAADTAAYQQYLNQLAYPFQTTQWEAGIDTGVGSQLGGTSSTTGPQPNLLSQIAGAGLLGVGTLGGLFGNQGALGGINPYNTANSARGGRIQGLQTGGTPSNYYPQFGGGYGAGVMPYGGGRSWVPSAGITHGQGAPRPPNLPQDNSAQQMFQAASKMAGNFGGAGTRANQQPGGPIGPIGTAPEAADILNQPTGSMVSDNAIFRKGGRVGYAGLKLPTQNRIQLKRGGVPVRAGLGVASFLPQRFADGGTPQDDTFDARFAPEPYSAPGPSMVPNAELMDSVLAYQMYGQPSPYTPSPPTAPADNAAGAPVTIAPQAAPAGLGAAPVGAAQDGDAMLPAQSTPTQGVGAGAAEPSGGGFLSGLGHALTNPDIDMSLMAAGAGMLASRSPFAGVGIGEGVEQGLGTYGQLQQFHLQQKKEQQDVDLRVKALDQQAKQEQDRLAIEAKQYGLSAQKEAFEESKPFPMGQTISPIGLPMTTYGVHGPNNTIIPATGGQPGVGGAQPGAGGAPAASPLLNPDAVKAVASAYVAGDTTAISGLGFGNIGAINRGAVWNEIASELQANGASGKDLASARANFMGQSAAMRTASQREANVNTAVNEAQATFPLALEASRNLPRGAFVPWNQAVQMVQAGTSSPELTRYVTALRGAMTAYSQAMSRTGTNSVYAQNAAEELLNKAAGPDAIAAALDQMGKEMQAAQIAPETTRQGILARISGHGAPAVPAGAAAPTMSPQDQQALGWANANPSDPRAAEIKRRLGVQ